MRRGLIRLLTVVAAVATLESGPAAVGHHSSQPISQSAQPLPEVERLANTVLAASSAEARAQLLGEVPERARRELAVALIPIVERHRIAGELERAQAAGQLAVDIAAAFDDPSLRARTLNSLGSILNERGRFDDAQAVLERSRDFARIGGDKAPLADALLFLSIARFRKGSPADALAIAEESLAISRELGHRDGIVSALATMGMAERQRGNFDRAIGFYEEAIDVGQGPDAGVTACPRPEQSWRGPTRTRQQRGGHRELSARRRDLRAPRVSRGCRQLARQSGIELWGSGAQRPGHRTLPEEPRRAAGDRRSAERRIYARLHRIRVSHARQQCACRRLLSAVACRI